MRASTFALCLLLAARALAEDSPLSLELELAPAEPKPGQHVFWLARLTNRTGATIRLPSTMKQGGFFTAVHEKPDESSGFGVGTAALPKDPPKFEWLPLGPGAAWEWAGEVGATVDACRKGCPEGTLYATFLVESYLAPKTEGDRVIPPILRANENLTISRPRPMLLPLTAEGSVTARILGAKQGKAGVRVRYELVNATNAPLWLPKTGALDATCTCEPPGSGLGRGGWGSELRPWGPKSGALVPPGKSLAGELACEGHLATGARINLSVAPPSEFESERPLASPFVWAGRAQAPEFVAK